MRISFILPAYYRTPIGGYRVVYEYADFLASRGHEVSIVFPRRCRDDGRAKSWKDPINDRLWGPKIRLQNRRLIPWHALDPRVQLRLVPTLSEAHMPDGDVTVATAWSTAGPVAEVSRRKGAKFYLIQGYETWAGPEEEVNATWRLPLHKIVISRWLEELGQRLGTTDMRYIPNGIDLGRFRVITPPESRPLSVLTLAHKHPLKGVADALAVLTRFHEKCPNVPVGMFGAHPRDAEIPEWIEYFENPVQEALARDVYNRHAIYLGASLSEGWALTPAEGMACGCAFVGTDSGGLRDYASDGDTALLSPPGDRDALLANLIRMAENASLRTRIQRRGTENIQAFTWAASGRAMEAYFLGQAATGVGRNPAGRPDLATGERSDSVRAR